MKFLPTNNIKSALIKGGKAFGMRMHPILKVLKLHEGVDDSEPAGTPVYATDDGKVLISKMQDNRKGYGNYVVIRHKECDSLSAHLSKRAVNSGQIVKAGDIIGYVGSTGDSTGPHLHYGMCKDFLNNSNRGWFDPLQFIQKCEKEIEEVKTMLERVNKAVDISNPEALEKQLKEQKNTSMWYLIDKLLKKLGA